MSGSSAAWCWMRRSRRRRHGSRWEPKACASFPSSPGDRRPTSRASGGTIVGLEPRHTPAHVYRAYLESIALMYRGFAQRSVALGGNAIRWVFTIGGSGAKNALWNQIKADALQAPVYVLPQLDYHARGALQIVLLGMDHACGLGHGVLNHGGGSSRGESDRGGAELPIPEPVAIVRPRADQAEALTDLHATGAGLHLTGFTPGFAQTQQANVETEGAEWRVKRTQRRTKI